MSAAVQSCAAAMAVLGIFFYSVFKRGGFPVRVNQEADPAVQVSLPF
jgi:hypothetical protein